MKTLSYLRVDLRREDLKECLYHDIRFCLTQGDYFQAEKKARKLAKVTGDHYVLSTLPVCTQCFNCGRLERVGDLADDIIGGFVCKKCVKENIL